MNFIGTYKAKKMVQCTENRGVVFEDIDKLLAKATDIDDKRMLEQAARSLIYVDEEANIQQMMEIPENTPVDEIEKMKKKGMPISKDGRYVILETNPGKIEDGELYLYDKSTFLTGKEWVKISTDVEDELHLVTTIYKKME